MHLYAGAHKRSAQAQGTTRPPQSKTPNCHLCAAHIPRMPALRDTNAALCIPQRQPWGQESHLTVQGNASFLFTSVTVPSYHSSPNFLRIRAPTMSNSGCTRWAGTRGAEEGICSSCCCCGRGDAWRRLGRLLLDAPHGALVSAAVER